MKKIKEEVKKTADKIKNGVKNGFRNLQGKFKKKKQDSPDESPKVDVPQIDINQVTYRKKRKGLPRLLVTSGSKRLKRTAMIVIPAMLVIGGGVLGYLEANKNKNLPSEVVLNQGSDHHRIYLLSSDDYVIPISVNRTPKYTLAEEVLDVFEYLKVGVKDVNRYLRGYLPAATKINDINLTDHVLTIDFSEEFNDYAAKDELQILQSLVFTFLEFDGVDSFHLKVNGESLTAMPKKLTPVITNFDRSYGINTVNATVTDVLTKGKTVVYYMRTYDRENTFYIPVSVYANKGQTVANTFYNALDYNPGILSGLKKVALYNHIDKAVDPLLTDDSVIIDLKDTALLDEGTIQKDIFDLLVLNLYLANVPQKVSLQVNGETYRVNGYQDTNSIAVSSIISSSVAI